MGNIGDKFIIELAVECPNSNNDRYFILKNTKGMQVMVKESTLDGFEKWDEQGAIKQLEEFSKGVSDDIEAAYQRGLDDAWEAARKVCGYITDRGMSNEELRKAFGTEVLGEIIVLPIGKVMNILTKHEAKKKAAEEIKVGDEITVRVHNPERTINVIVYDVLKFGSTYVYDTFSFEEGECFNISWNPEIEKTGRHFPQVAELLDAMKEGD